MRAINSATSREVRLREFCIDAVTGGQDALGEASVILELYCLSDAGQGVSTDIIEASALAPRARSSTSSVGVMAAEEPLELPGRRKPIGGPGVRRGRLQLS